jgi:hypothetical protein
MRCQSLCWLLLLQCSSPALFVAIKNFRKDNSKITDSRKSQDVGWLPFIDAFFSVQLLNIEVKLVNYPDKPNPSDSVVSFNG